MTLTLHTMQTTHSCLLSTYIPNPFWNEMRLPYTREKLGHPGIKDAKTHLPPSNLYPPTPPKKTPELVSRNSQSFMYLLKFLADYILSGWLVVHLPTITLPMAAQKEESGTIPWLNSFRVPLPTPNPKGDQP